MVACWNTRHFNLKKGREFFLTKCYVLNKGTTSGYILPQVNSGKVVKYCWCKQVESS